MLCTADGMCGLKDAEQLEQTKAAQDSWAKSKRASENAAYRSDVIAGKLPTRHTPYIPWQ
jgi:hypothetical protein